MVDIAHFGIKCYQLLQQRLQLCLLCSCWRTSSTPRPIKSHHTLSLADACTQLPICHHPVQWWSYSAHYRFPSCMHTLALEPILNITSPLMFPQHPQHVHTDTHPHLNTYCSAIAAFGSPAALAMLVNGNVRNVRVNTDTLRRCLAASTCCTRPMLLSCVYRCVCV